MGSYGGRRRGPSVRAWGRRTVLVVALASTLLLAVLLAGGAPLVGAEAASPATSGDGPGGSVPAAAETDRHDGATPADERPGANESRSDGANETERRIGPDHRHGYEVVDRGSEVDDEESSAERTDGSANASGTAGSDERRSPTGGSTLDGAGGDDDRRSTPLGLGGTTLATAVVAPIAGVLAIVLAVRSARE